MNRSHAIILALAVLVGFALSGGFGRVVEARRLSEKNARVKEVNANISNGISLIRRQLLDRRFLSIARDFIDIPPEWRHSNYALGSCVHATTESLLEWQGLHDQAQEWRRRYSGGEATAQPPHTRKMDSMGLKYVVTNNGDVELLEWACATRRGCGIAYPAGHCIALVGHENGQAVFLDNNHVGRLDREPWDGFVAKWKRIGGNAFAFVYNPPPPTPH